MNNLKQWKKERDAAVKTLDIEVWKKFYAKWHKAGVYNFPCPRDEVLEISIRKMACNTPKMPKDVKEEAEMWLKARGYSTSLG